MTIEKALELIKNTSGLSTCGVFGTWSGEEREKMNETYLKQIKLEPKNRALIVTYLICNYNGLLADLATELSKVIE